MVGLERVPKGYHVRFLGSVMVMLLRRVFADVIKLRNLKWDNWIIRVVPKSSDHCPYKTKAEESFPGGLCVLVTQSCLTLRGPMDCSPPGSSVYGILQARILEWVAISSFRGSSQPRDWTHVYSVFCTDRRILHHLNHEKLPWWSSGWEFACQWRGHGFDPWSSKFPYAVEQLSSMCHNYWASTLEPRSHNYWAPLASKY